MFFLSLSRDKVIHAKEERVPYIEISTRLGHVSGGLLT